MSRKPVDKLLGVIDFETDPFKYGRIPKPFAVGILHEQPSGLPCYVYFWGGECVADMVDYFTALSYPLTIYAHNGGRFDFYLMLRYLQNPIRIIHGRVICAGFGKHQLRDSWAIIPMPLKAANKKDSISYEKLEADVREKHRVEILAYLRTDCVSLFELVVAFNARFGPRLTIASTAMRELVALHPQFHQRESHDDMFRPYYFGGRVECFEFGVINAPLKLYDVNSMYPHAMREFRHPLGAGYLTPGRMRLNREGWFIDFPGSMYFATVTGWNKGALPMRDADNNGGLSFTATYGVFQTTSHELRAAMQLGLFKVDTILDARVPRNTQTFTTFVDTFVAEKIKAKRTGDPIGERFAKLILNSAYGRFGIDPFEFYDYAIVHYHDDDQRDYVGEGFEPYESNRQYVIWRRRTNERALPGEGSTTRGFADVAIAASITSAARSVLMRAIVGSIRPIYCDTDSIICEGLRGVSFSDTALGAWKLEGTGNRIAIAGKKLYALYNDQVVVKVASKGVKLTGDEITRVALGEQINWKNDAPNFALGGGASFTHRTAKSTIRRQ